MPAISRNKICATILFSVLLGCTPTVSTAPMGGGASSQEKGMPVFPANIRPRLAVLLANEVAEAATGPAMIEQAVVNKAFGLGATYASFLVKYPYRLTGIFGNGSNYVKCLLVIQKGSSINDDKSDIIVETMNASPKLGDLARRSCGSQNFVDYTELNKAVSSIKSCKSAGSTSCAAPVSLDKLEDASFMESLQLTVSDNPKRVFRPAT